MSVHLNFFELNTETQMSLVSYPTDNVEIDGWVSRILGGSILKVRPLDLIGEYYDENTNTNTIHAFVRNQNSSAIMPEQLRQSGFTP